jgi:hypothetical protein
MNLPALAKHARLLLRSEVLIAEIRLRLYARKLALAGFAVLAAIMGLAFVNLAAYVYLQILWGPLWTPLAIGLVNFAIALVALLAAMLARPGPDLTVAEELRKLSGNALNDELHDHAAATGVLGAMNEPLVARLLVPAVVSIITALRRRKATGSG